jgi:hypothetical protein
MTDVLKVYEAAKRVVTLESPDLIDECAEKIIGQKLYVTRGAHKLPLIVDACVRNQDGYLITGRVLFDEYATEDEVGQIVPAIH